LRPSHDKHLRLCFNTYTLGGQSLFCTAALHSSFWLVLGLQTIFTHFCFLVYWVFTALTEDTIFASRRTLFFFACSTIVFGAGGGWLVRCFVEYAGFGLMLLSRVCWKTKSYQGLQLRYGVLVVEISGCRCGIRREEKHSCFSVVPEKRKGYWVLDGICREGLGRHRTGTDDGLC